MSELILPSLLVFGFNLVILILTVVEFVSGPDLLFLVKGRKVAKVRFLFLSIPSSVGRAHGS